MSTDVLQNIQTYEDWARDFYEPLAVRHYDQAIARMVKWLAPSPQSEVLDAGCGTGVHSVRVAQMGFRVRAIDISPVALRAARQSCEETNLSDRIKFERGDVTNLTFADETFETIFSWGVVIHIHDIERSLRELVRVLKPGGRLALQVTNSKAIDCRIEAIGRRLLRKPKSNAEMNHYGYGAWDDGQFWTVQLRVPMLVNYMKQLGCVCVHRMASEFTELQCLARGPIRTALRLANHGWFALHLPATLACTNILIFQKRS